MKLRQDVLSERRPDAGNDPGRNGSRLSREGLAARFREQPVLNTLLAALCIAAIVLAITAIGPASQSSGQSARTTTVKRGVVQSTVSGSGNIESADQLDLGFKTSGTVTHIYVANGQHVTQGQLLAAVDPTNAELALEQAKATLQSAEANLAKEEEDEGETTTGQAGSGAATASAATASDVADTASVAASTPPPATGTATGGGSQTTSTGAATTTSPTTSTSNKSTPKSGSSAQPAKTTESSSSASQTTSGQGTSSTTKQSAATREANLASAKAAVKSDRLAVQNDQQAVGSTKLYAPENGTIVSLSGEVGETVSATGTKRASSSASGSSSSASSSTGASAATGQTGATGGSSSSSQGSSSSSFAVLSNLESLQLVVALSESEVGDVHAGQIATVTIEALSGRKVAAHVVGVSQVPTSSSGAVSYDVTFQLDQGAGGLKVGMSASAEVVVKQADGLNVPTSAIKGGAVTVVHGGKREARSVATGLAGDSSTIILSGLKAGEEIALPTTTSSGSSVVSRLGSRAARGLGGALGGGGGAGGLGGGGFAGGGPAGG
ncbi:MAG TPA: biotin/lipoyl-binding protein [Solirubrobacteraceae bacterium]|jgi:multidrug efflux pump subunit AcrA (membrane-fusion protein)|nr:biotin/lipoyl-binding protein [Solirubrobacteraceae bacterium]